MTNITIKESRSRSEDGHQHFCLHVSRHGGEWRYQLTGDNGVLPETMEREVDAFRDMVTQRVLRKESV